MGKKRSRRDWQEGGRHGRTYNPSCSKRAKSNRGRRRSNPVVSEDDDSDWCSSSEATSTTVTTAAGIGADEPSGNTFNLTSGDLQRHPLYNEVILSNLFRIMPQQLLATCREVCRTWREASLPAWRSTAFLEITYAHEASITLGGKYAEKLNKTALDDFLKFWKISSANTGTPPYQNFRLICWDFFWGQQKDKKKQQLQSQIDGYFEMCAPSVKKLELTHCSFPGLQEFRRALFDSFPNMEALVLENPSIKSPNSGGSGKGKKIRQFSDPAAIDLEPVGAHQKLKSFSYISSSPRFHSSPNSNLGHPLPLSWVELLAHFPALTSLQLHDEGKHLEELRKQINAIEVIRSKDGKKLPLKRFEILPHLEVSQENHDLLQTIQQLGLPLQCVKLSLDQCGNLMEHLAVLQNVLVEVLGQNLTKIEVSKWKPYVEIIPCDFPFGFELPNLLELSMPDRFCPTMEFLKLTPNLRKLRIFDNWNDGKLDYVVTSLVASTDQASMADVKVLNLKEFYLGYGVTANDLEKLVKWLPNVEKLSMFLSDAQFPIVCEHWRDLTHLHVLGEELTDSGVTGRENGRDRPIRNQDGPQQESIPNVTWLKKLQCFKIAFHRSKLGAASLLDGFLELAHLQILDISPYVSDGTSGDRALKAMRKKIPKFQARQPLTRGRSAHNRNWWKVRCTYND